MKQYILVFISLVLCSNSISSQEPLLLKKPLWKSKFVLYSDTTIVQTAIFELKDSSIMLANSTLKKDYQLGNYSIQEIYIPQISTIKSKKRIGWLYGMVIGAGAGLMVGGILAASAQDDPPCSENNPIASILCAFTWQSAEDKAAGRIILPTALGIGAGAIIGSIYITIPIDGSMHQYNYNKKKLSRYSLKY